MVSRRIQKGFSLLEILLVLAIMGLVLTLITNYTTQKLAQLRRDRAVVQIQQILNAALSYYVSNGAWPQPCENMTLPPSATKTFTAFPGNPLQTNSYLPQNFPSPWVGSNYGTDCDNTTGQFFVAVTTGGSSAAQDAQIVAGMVPNGQFSSETVSGSTTSIVFASVNIPGQNLNNARSVNFTGIYHHGACVPQPICPGNMTAQIIVYPTAVSGVYQAPTKSDGKTPCTSTSFTDSAGNTITGDCANNIQYAPIESINAYATGPVAASSTAGPPACDDTTATPAPCYSVTACAAGSSCSGSGPSAWVPITDGNKYYRVCLVVATEAGGVIHIPDNTTPSSNQNMFWTTMLGSIVATTRCAPQNENPGSDFTIYGN